ncbi:heme biosynthesis HemY N-terminal domain-containing protein [Thorsellia kenyensis]|uniref:Heme biosynthesis HemY N-terminal domain-containing protein n=1 Tax=Thorsellia kenyensis TaxID=1549888 RepID=A0ABV6C9C2_9GAMM
MIKLLIIFIIGLVALGLGPFLIEQQGVVFIQMSGYEIETTVTVLIVMLLALLLIYWFIMAILKRVFLKTKSVSGWFSTRKKRASENQTQLALMKFLEGDLKLAEKALIKGAKHAQFPALNYLLAAEIAQKQGNFDGSQHYLVLASAGQFDNELALDLTQIRLLIEKGDFNTATVRIERLRISKPIHPEVLKLSAQIYLGSKAYSALIQLLPTLSKQGVYSYTQIEEFKKESYHGLMLRIIKEESVDGLVKWWESLPRIDKKDALIQSILVETFLNEGDIGKATEYYQIFIKQHISSELLRLLERFDSLDWQSMNKRLKKWENKLSDIDTVNQAKLFISYKIENKSI